MSKNTYSVYCHMNKVNGKRYIGITARKPEKRWGANGCNYKGQLFYSAIQKYGWDNFSHEILYKNLSKEEAESLEIELIAKFNTRDDDFGYNVAIGGMLTDEFTVKPVDQYDFDGNFICSWNSIIECAKYHNIDSSVIIDMCKGYTRRSIVCGYIFRYKGEPFDKYDSSYTIGGARKVYQFTTNGEFVAEYETVTSAEITMGSTTVGNIVRAIKSNTLAYGYVWSYNKEFHFNIDEYGCMVSVDKYDTNGNYIESYNSLIDGARSAGRSYEGVTNIKSVCDGQTITAYGYVWRYKGRPFNEFSLEKKTNAIAVNQYTTNNIFVNTHPSAKQAGISLNSTSYGGITNCCKGRSQTAYGYKWYYADDVNQPDKTKIIDAKEVTKIA